MDALRAQMALQGYEVPGLTPKERERVWYSLAGKRRRTQLVEALQLDEDAIEALVASVRHNRARLLGHR
jgi:hypothetical protein